MDLQPFTPCYSYKNGQMRVYQKWTLDIGHSVHKVSYPGLQYMYARLYSRSEHWRVTVCLALNPGLPHPDFISIKSGRGRPKFEATFCPQILIPGPSVHVRKVLLHINALHSEGKIGQRGEYPSSRYRMQTMIVAILPKNAYQLTTISGGPYKYIYSRGLFMVGGYTPLTQSGELQLCDCTALWELTGHLCTRDRRKMYA